LIDKNKRVYTRERRYKMMNRLMVIVVVVALVFPGVAWAQEEAVLAEFLVRPLGFASFVVGSATFFVTLPVSIAVGGTGTMAEVLVKKPYRFTFQRDMGDGLLPPDENLEER
jgi:hypothetical protein